MQNAKLFNYLHLHLIVFIWGFTAVLGALISIEAIPLVWFRMLFASFFIILYIRIRNVPLRNTRKTLGAFLVAGFLIALHWLTFFGAIKISNVSVTLAVMSTGAFFTSFIEPIYYKRRIVGYEVLFGFLAMIGLYIIFRVESDNILGIILALCSAFLAAMFAVINGKLVQRHRASVISFYELFFGMLCISIFLAFRGDFSQDFFRLKGSDWIYLLVLASVCTAYAFLASVNIMKWLSPYTVMLTINLEPVYGIILALLILGDSENMSPGFYYGALIILLTVLANGVFKMRTKRKMRKESD